MFINLKNITVAFNEKVNVQECPLKIYRKEQINKVVNRFSNWFSKVM